jgi:hypothetical protein
MALILVAVACGGERAPASGKSGDGVAVDAAAASDEPKHATAGVQPGSHEDWCGEHQVPESLCTRCNPSLVAAFKATGDWCGEHGLPESQCLVCNPDLKIERPPKKEVQ